MMKKKDFNYAVRLQELIYGMGRALHEIKIFNKSSKDLHERYDTEGDFKEELEFFNCMKMKFQGKNFEQEIFVPIDPLIEILETHMEKVKVEFDKLIEE